MPALGDWTRLWQSVRIPTPSTRNKRKVRGGACLVDGMMIGTRWLMGYIKARTRGEAALLCRFWVIENMDDPGSSNSMSNRDTMLYKEVLATLSRFQFQESQGRF